MSATTKLRLYLDLGIQLFAVLVLLLCLWWRPTLWAYFLGGFVFLVSSWQIFHATYVVKKYQDWKRGRYLRQVKKVLVYSVALLLLSGLLVLSSMGYLWPVVRIILQGLGLVLAAVLVVLASRYFVDSLQNFYYQRNKPRSFWDL